MDQGGLFVVSAPSGTGKTSLVAELVKRLPNLMVSISHTTRSKRSGERDGINYFFVGRDAFDHMVSSGAMLEYANVFGEGYGTSKDWVLAKLDAGQDVILEIDTQGAEQVRSMYPEAVSIFILPPSMPVLRSRIQARRQDDEASIAKRMEQVQGEVGQYKHYDYLLVNDDFDLALKHLACIVQSARLRIKRQEPALRKILESFALNS